MQQAIAESSLAARREGGRRTASLREYGGSAVKERA
jgi:hypothetical protein